MLSAIGIITEDLNKSKEFYELFGFNFESFGDGNHLEASNGNIKIMLDSVELAKKLDPNFEYQLNSVINLCFEFKTLDELSTKFSELKSKGFLIHKEPFDAFWGQKYAVVLDPSGNKVDLFCELS